MEVSLVDGKPQVVEKVMDGERLNHLVTHGRGRLLHPKSELEAMDHPWDKTPREKDTECVPEDAAPLLEVEDLQVYFPVKRGVMSRVIDHVRAVDGVSFRVYRGQTLGLVGESGCGKTTTGRAILRLIEPTGGSVRFDNVDLCGMSTNELRKLRSRMQIIFQDPYGSLNPRMTIESAVHRADGHPGYWQLADRSPRTGCRLARRGWPQRQPSAPLPT